MSYAKICGVFLTGCLVHGVGPFNYFDFLQWPHDCNLTLCTFLETILQISRHQLLSNRLLIQMDNCVRENKNKYVMGFFAILVELGIFSEVSLYLMQTEICHDELGFLMVGHTHT